MCQVKGIIIDFNSIPWTNGPCGPESWHPEMAVSPGFVQDSFVNNNNNKKSHCKCTGFRGMPKKIALRLTTCHYRKIEVPAFQSDFYLTLQACKFCHEVRGRFRAPESFWCHRHYFKMDMLLGFLVLFCQGHGINGALSEENSQSW